MHQTTPYYLAFQKLGVGAGTLRRLRESIPDLATLWRAGRSQLEATGISDNFIERFQAQRATLDPEVYTASIVHPEIAVLGLDDPTYPPLLKETSSPPLALFVRGRTDVFTTRSLTVVGTRGATADGTEAVRRLVGPLASGGLTIISGLAFGIDAAAHAVALEHGGRTVAVLGSGIDQITPYANAGLGRKILADGGTIISEYPPGTRVQKHHFPQRNRILAGLSSATLVVEAGPNSGALITAKFALEEGREVLAVPGSITRETSSGTNRLLRDGAAPAIEPDDIRRALGLDIRPSVSNHIQIDVRSEVEARLVALLREPRHVDELVEMSRLDTSVVNAALSILELRGLVRHLGGMRFARTY